jgi:hypothetical protein
MDGSLAKHLNLTERVGGCHKLGIVPRMLGRGLRCRAFHDASQLDEEVVKHTLR